MFQSSSTIFHANKAVNHLSEYYTNEEIERRVEHIYKADYDNKYLDLAVRLNQSNSDANDSHRMLDDSSTCAVPRYNANLFIENTNKPRKRFLP